MEESYILATSPNVRLGGNTGQNITIEPLKPATGDNDDEYVGE
ncbi:hypothetical protein HMPREF0666_00213 [Prevotella sp. C561]|nr:hypothetical protein [Prevotella sp. C561]EGW48636.1 hypothetical protein HMPREF0666_00213 [Prevotella sp. C561]